ncbi:MAG: hypothetical protein QY327_06565 [Fimbriimonadaceae bacterium]|nr:MAG: hypothetical protein UZ18_ATM001001369 [Armatimonadetes bacterium OLB18]WKZ81559.1 MAG: hypothetical protein QY327_06565 [Fimbriimonadaceae bacterium]
MKLRASTKILVGFIAVIAASYFGYRTVTSYYLQNQKFEPLLPRRVNLLGVDTSKGYHIVVSNQIAHLVQGGGGKFEAPSDRGEKPDLSNAKRIPIREMLRALQGDSNALGRFLMSVNNIDEGDLPPYPVIWPRDQLLKALEGDAELKAKLESDLNIQLDGTPLGVVRTEALEQGIVIELPITVEAKVEGRVKKLVGTLPIPFQTRFARTVFDRYKEKPEITSAIVLGAYREEAQKLLDNPELREDIGGHLKSLLDEENLKRYAEIPESLLNSVTVVVNSDLIDSAGYSERRDRNGKPIYTMELNLNGEGRTRLWQYSRDNLGSQLLLVWDGIAIAAPRISHELVLSQVTISQLTDLTLVQDACEAINQRDE